MDREPSERADVCVVGAGPAGALVASRLACDGGRCRVRGGPRFDFSRRQQQMEEHIRPGMGNPWEMGGPRTTTRSGRHYPLNAARVKGVGGTTLHWQGMVMRLHRTRLRREPRHRRSGWPISYDDLRPYYADAERALGVAGDADNPFAPPRDGAYPLPGFPPSYSDSLFAEACERLGITMHSVPNARNSEPYDGRGPCVGYGTCQPVCPSGAKYDASGHIEDAEARGHALSTARRSSVLLLTPTDASRRPSTRRRTGLTPTTGREFVIAAGGVETLRFHLLSASGTTGRAGEQLRTGRPVFHGPSVRRGRRTRRP